MADFRLRIGFAKTGAAVWLSHLEVVRAMERCVRRSGLPYTVSQGFSPHMKHSFSPALPVGTGSAGEFMDVELAALVDAEEALEACRAAQHENLPILSADYVHKDEPSLQVFFNQATYQIELEDAEGAITDGLLKRLNAKEEIEVIKKGKPKVYDLKLYIVEAQKESDARNKLTLTLLSRPEGSLRPEVIIEAISEPDVLPNILSISRSNIDHREL